MYDFEFSVERMHICNHIPVISAVCWGIPTEALRFDTSLEALEDWELWLAIYNRLKRCFVQHHIPTSIYYRVPGESSMTNDALKTSEGRDRYTRSFASICARYPCESERVQKGRSIYREFEKQINSLLIQGLSPRENAYERLLLRLDSLIEDCGVKLDWSWLEADARDINPIARK